MPRVRTIVMPAALLLAAGALLTPLPRASAIAQPGKAKEPAKPAAKQPANPKPDDKAQTLKVGDVAPELRVDEWIKGEAVPSLEKGTVYVVEFWATWCGPCKRTIPHLTQLQKDHPKAIIIGVAASERKDKDGADNRLAKLKSFVTEQGDAMGYRVAYDADRKAHAGWMQAAGQTGIPRAFVVGADGKIAWIGHPSSLGPELQKALDAGALTGTPVKDRKPKPTK